MVHRNYDGSVGANSTTSLLKSSSIDSDEDDFHKRRGKEITRRRGAVKHQRYTPQKNKLRLNARFSEYTKSRVTSFWRNFSASRRFVPSVKISFGGFANRVTNVNVSDSSRSNFCFIVVVVACQTAVHKRCHDKLLGKCPESGRESESTIVS